MTQTKTRPRPPGGQVVAAPPARGDVKHQEQPQGGRGFMR